MLLSRMVMHPRPASAVNVVAKAVQVVKACHALGGNLSLGDIARQVGLPRSTVQRIVRTLIAEGFLSSTGAARSISLGPDLLAMGAASAMDVVARTHPLLRELSRQTGETVDLSRLNRDHAVFVNQVPGSHRLQAISAVGATFPLHCTANGKAMLALLGPAELQVALARPLQAFTPKTIVKNASLLRELDRVRKSGIAVDDEEHTLGICAIGMAFRTPAHQLFAISIPVPAVRFAAMRRQCEAVLGNALADLPWMFGSPDRQPPGARARRSPD